MPRIEDKLKNAKHEEEKKETLTKHEEIMLEQKENIISLSENIKSHDEKFAKLKVIISRLEEMNLKHLYRMFKKFGAYEIANSLILTEENNIDLIKKWIDENKSDLIDFQLLYRGTKHGKSAQAFHSRCDNKGPTLTIIKTTTKRVFGGFTMLEWDSTTSNYKANDPKAFIFSMDEKKKFTCNNQNEVIIGNSNYGPIFGAGFDICISNNWDYNNTYSYLGHSFGKDQGITEGSFYLLGNNDSNDFTPEEVEVYSVLNL